MANKAFKVETEFTWVDKTLAPYRKMRARIKALGRQHGTTIKKTNRGFKSLASKGIGALKLATVGFAAALLGVTTALAGVTMAFKALVTTGMDFEQVLTNAGVKFQEFITPGTKGFRMLERAALRVGGATEFTSSQAAVALNSLAMAGFTAAQAVGSLSGLADLATAAEVNLAEASQMAAGMLGSLGLRSDDPLVLAKNLKRMSDVMARTATSSLTSFREISEAMSIAGLNAVQAGADIEQLAAFVGTLANANVRGHRAGIALKNVFLRLSAPTKEAARALDYYGVQTRKANGDLRDATLILGELNKSLAGLGSAERAGVLDAVFGKIPIASVNALLKEANGGLTRYEKQLRKSNITTTTMAGIMRSTVKGAWKELISAVETTGITIFNVVKGSLESAIRKTTQWVRANKELLAQNIGRWIMKAASSALRFAKVIFFLWKILKGVVSVVMFFGEALVGVLRILQAVNKAVSWLVEALTGIKGIETNIFDGAISSFYELKSALNTGLPDIFAGMQQGNSVLSFSSDGSIVPPSFPRATSFNPEVTGGQLGQALGGVGTLNIQGPDNFQMEMGESKFSGLQVNLQNTGGF